MTEINDASEAVMPGCRFVPSALYARAAMVWAVAGGILFLPCAILLFVLFGLGRGMAGPVLAAVAIVLTYVGAYLFYSGGGLLLAQRRGWAARLILAPLATWNILVVLSAMLVYGLAQDIVRSGWQMPALSVFLSVCAVLHVFVNAAFLLGLPFVKRPAPESGSP